MDLNKIVSGLSSSGAVSGFAGGLAGSALAGALGGKKGRKMAKGALKVGAVAAVGGLAYKAYQNYQANQGNSQSSAPATPASAPTKDTNWNALSDQRFETIVENEEGSDAMLVVQAMIAAASADGHLDADEQKRVFDTARTLDLAQDEKAMLFDELQNPKSMSDIVERVNCPELAVEIYAAALVAVDQSRSEAKAWLDTLALSLNIPQGLVDSIHAEAEAAQTAG